MQRIARLLTALLSLALCGCASGQAAPAPAIATPGPRQETQIQGLFRGEGEPEEVVELDAEHGCWAYRSDTLGIAVEFSEREYDGEMAAWCFAEIAWLDEDPLRPQELAPAPENSILFLAQTEELPLIENGVIVADGGERMQRAGYGTLPNGGYIVIALSGRYEGGSRGLDAEEFATLFLEAGCVRAVELSSGPAAVMCFMGTALNDPIAGEAPEPDAGIGFGLAAK